MRKNIIFNVIKYFEDEKERHGKQKFRPNAVMQKAAEATGVPLRTLRRLSNANCESKKIKCKKAKLSREKFGKLDDFDLGVIRRLIHQFYLRNESPTLDKILKELKEKMDFPYSRSRLHKLLKKMGFSFKFRGKERLICSLFAALNRSKSIYPSENAEETKFEETSFRIGAVCICLYSVQVSFFLFFFFLYFLQLLGKH